MNHAALALRESHTVANDLTVNSSQLLPGVPLFVVGGWGDNRHFRAGLTPLPDSSLLVYKAAPAHPLGLVAGDIVLGYGGVPWKRLYRELLAARLPLTGWWWGSSESSWTHSMLMSAGRVCCAWRLPSSALSDSSVREPLNWRTSRTSFRFLSLSSTIRISSLAMCYASPPVRPAPGRARASDG